MLEFIFIIDIILNKESNLQFTDPHQLIGSTMPQTLKTAFKFNLSWFTIYLFSFIMDDDDDKKSE